MDFVLPGECEKKSNIFPDFRHKTIRPDRDIDIKGHVSWVGSSSLEVSMRVLQVDKFSPVLLRMNKNM